MFKRIIKWFRDQTKEMKSNKELFKAANSKGPVKRKYTSSSEGYMKKGGINREPPKSPRPVPLKINPKALKSSYFKSKCPCCGK